MLTDIDKKNPQVPEMEENIIDVTIDGIKKQKFRINGKDILELDITDLNVVQRLKEVYPKLDQLAKKATDKVNLDSDKPVEDQLGEMADTLKEIDDKMREYIDYIFDSNVSEICAPHTSLYSPHGGKFTFEHITETLGNLYANGLDEEAKKMSKRFKEHTYKYTGRKRK